jgi:hypothetical protein
MGVYGGDSSISDGGANYYAIVALDSGFGPVTYEITNIGKKSSQLEPTGAVVSDGYWEFVTDGFTRQSKCALIERKHWDRMDAILF